MIEKWSSSWASQKENTRWSIKQNIILRGCCKLTACHHNFIGRFRKFPVDTSVESGQIAKFSWFQVWAADFEFENTNHRLNFHVTWGMKKGACIGGWCWWSDKNNWPAITVRYPISRRRKGVTLVISSSNVWRLVGVIIYMHIKLVVLGRFVVLQHSSIVGEKAESGFEHRRRSVCVDMLMIKRKRGRNTWLKLNVNKKCKVSYI